MKMSARRFYILIFGLILVIVVVYLQQSYQEEQRNGYLNTLRELRVLQVNLTSIGVPNIKRRKIPVQGKPVRTEKFIEPEGQYGHRWPVTYISQPRGAQIKGLPLAINMFTREIDHVREFIKNRPRVPWRTPVRMIDALEPDYFSTMEDMHNIATVFFKLPKVQFLSLFPKRWFVAHSNNCSRLETHSQGNSRLNVLLKCTESEQYPNYDIQGIINNLVEDFDFQSGLLKMHSSFTKIKENKDSGLISVGYLHVIKHAIIDSSGDFCAAGSHILIQRCHREAYENLTKEDMDNIPTFKEVFVIGQYWGNAFFHFVNENLPRLIFALHFLQRNKDVKVFVDDKNEFTMNILADIGISSDRLVSRSVKTEIAYLPRGAPCGRPPIINTLLLSALLTANSNSKPDTVILIKRSAVVRWFMHHSLILNKIQDIVSSLPHKLKVTVFDDQNLPSYQETKELFHRAVMVVAPHGAGLSNLMFSQPGTCVVEGLCYDKYRLVQPCYQHLAHILGHIYHGVVMPYQCMDIEPNDLSPHITKCLSKVFNFTLPEFTCNANEYGCSYRSD